MHLRVIRPDRWMVDGLASRSIHQPQPSDESTSRRPRPIQRNKKKQPIKLLDCRPYPTDLERQVVGDLVHDERQEVVAGAREGVGQEEEQRPGRGPQHDGGDELYARCVILGVGLAVVGDGDEGMVYTQSARRVFGINR